MGCITQQARRSGVKPSNGASVGEIYESLDPRHDGCKLWVVAFGSEHVTCVQVEQQDEKWIARLDKPHRIKKRSLLPEAKLYRLLTSQPLQATRWGTLVSANIVYVSGDAIRSWRERYNLSTLDFSRLVGCTQRAVQKWERGQNEVPQLLVNFLELLDLADASAKAKYADSRNVSI